MTDSNQESEEMTNSNQESAEMVEEFCRLTNVEPDRARILLESAGWDYDIAIGNFYDGEDESLPYPLPSPNQMPVSKPPQPTNASRIVTMSSLMQNEDQSEEEGQAFYAGGSTRSGQQVLGPSRARGHNFVEEMFKAAKSHGAEVVEPTEESRRNSAHLRVFRGTGHVLGTPDGRWPVENAPSENLNHCTNVCLRAWRNGFTVDNGPLRDYADPANNEFLTSVRRGEIPQELIHKAKGQEVSLDLEDHSQENYVPQKQSLRAFSGQGHRLGSPTPRVSDPSRHGAYSCKNSEPAHKCKEDADKFLNVNLSQPTTIIQVKLADETRLIIKLNHTHTVGDIRQYIVIARPEYSASVFSLMTLYPSAELSDDNATVAEANLMNSVIVQKLL